MPAPTHQGQRQVVAHGANQIHENEPNFPHVLTGNGSTVGLPVLLRGLFLLVGRKNHIDSVPGRVGTRFALKGPVPVGHVDVNHIGFDSGNGFQRPFSPDKRVSNIGGNGKDDNGRHEAQTQCAHQRLSVGRLVQGIQHDGARARQGHGQRLEGNEVRRGDAGRRPVREQRQPHGTDGRRPGHLLDYVHSLRGCCETTVGKAGCMLWTAVLVHPTWCCLRGG